MRGFPKACRKKWSHSKWERCIKKLKESLKELMHTPSVKGSAWFCDKKLKLQVKFT
jgi:hypothetical protein